MCVCVCLCVRVCMCVCVCVCVFEGGAAADAVDEVKAVFKLLMWATFCNAALDTVTVYGFVPAPFMRKMLMPLMPKTNVRDLVAALSGTGRKILLNMLDGYAKAAKGSAPGTKGPAPTFHTLVPHAIAQHMLPLLGESSKASKLLTSLFDEKTYKAYIEGADEVAPYLRWRASMNALAKDAQRTKCVELATRDFPDIFAAYLERK